MDLLELRSIEEFEWDEGNCDKNELKHNVSKRECEQVFKSNFVLIDDNKHSQTEKRYGIYGKTLLNRALFLSITVRGNKIRVISARDQSRREKSNYEKAIENDTKI